MPRRRIISLKLTRRADGMFCKRVDGELMYFGYAGCTEEVARRELIKLINLRESGAVPTAMRDCPVWELATRYADACGDRLAAGTMQPATWADYDVTIKSFVKIVGRETIVGALTAERFSDVRTEWESRLGATRLNNQLQYIRTMFRWGVENLLIDRLPPFGSGFKKVGAAEVRMSRLIAGAVERKFTGPQIKTMLRSAKPPLKTFILLGLNAGMYSIDIADLRWSDLKRVKRNRIIDTTRGKTGIPRKFVLWPETAKLVDDVPRRGDLIFYTSHGNAWNNRQKHVDSIALLFRRFLKRKNLHTIGIGFGAFRHTHTSAVGDHPDQAAARLVRGHLIEGIERHYDFPSIERIKSITDLARRRLLNIGAQAARAAKTSSRQPKAHGRARAFARAGID